MNERFRIDYWPCDWVNEQNVQLIDWGKWQVHELRLATYSTQRKERGNIAVLNLSLDWSITKHI